MKCYVLTGYAASALQEASRDTLTGPLKTGAIRWTWDRRTHWWEKTFNHYEARFTITHHLFFQPVFLISSSCLMGNHAKWNKHWKKVQTYGGRDGRACGGVGCGFCWTLGGDSDSSGGSWGWSGGGGGCCISTWWFGWRSRSGGYCSGSGHCNIKTKNI